MLFVEEVSRFTAYNAAADNYDILCVLNKLGIFKDCNCLSGFGVFIAGKLEEDIFCACGYNDLVISRRLYCFGGNVRSIVSSAYPVEYSI